MLQNDSNNYPLLEKIPDVKYKPPNKSNLVINKSRPIESRAILSNIRERMYRWTGYIIPKKKLQTFWHT